MRYDRIDGLRPEYPVRMLCRLLNVSEAGYYAWRRRPPSPRAQENARLSIEIKLAHERTRQTYGPERLQAELADHGIHAGIDRIKRIRRKLGLRCKQKRKLKTTTDSRHPLPLAPNRLNRQFTVEAPNQAWVTDITYIRTHEGWLYLAVVLDLFSRQVIGWSMRSRIDSELAINALLMAIWRRAPKAPVTVHSDQGSQYSSNDWRDFLEAHGLVPSMSRRGNCHDNAVAESFFQLLKRERIRRKTYLDRDEARRDIFDYIEMFYNPKRRHGSANGLSPVEFERQYFQRLKSV